MRHLSEQGQKTIADIGDRQGFSAEAATSMLGALIAGNGRMAQFDHPEFGGSGQWMSGGMIMVSDLFDEGLKARVGALCRDLLPLVEAQGSPPAQGSQQTQSARPAQTAQSAQAGNDDGSDGDGRATQSADSSGGGFSGNFSSQSSSSGNWWPAELGQPDSTGSQNDARYAWFSGSHRLAISVHGKLTVHDTGDHRINGFSQQQSGSGSLGFTSQHGLIDIASLPVVETGKPEEHPAHKSGDASADRSANRPAHEPDDKPDDRPESKSSEMPGNKPAGRPAGDAETARADRPSDNRTDTSQDQGKSAAAHKPTHASYTYDETPALAEAVKSVQRTPDTQPGKAPAGDGSGAGSSAASGNQPQSQHDVFTLIEKLADLRTRGLLSDEEFGAKKTELLGRI
jgi:hypothetical protein